MKKKIATSKFNTKVFFSICFIALVLWSCGQNKFHEANLNTSEMISEETYEAEESMMMYSKTAEKPNKKEKSETWKRSNKMANSISLFVGDNETIPLKGLQQIVTVDGFRARVLYRLFLL